MQLPELTLEANSGGPVSIPGDLKGKYTVLYFYPKDDTPGCTKQACTYRDMKAEFDAIGAAIYGVSMDDLASHDAFAAKYTLNFPLLFDKDGQLANALGVYGEQEWRGKTYMGLSRDTFLIGPEGEVVREWRKVDPESSVTESLEAIRSLKA